MGFRAWVARYEKAKSDLQKRLTALQHLRDDANAQLEHFANDRKAELEAIKVDADEHWMALSKAVQTYREQVSKH